MEDNFDKEDRIILASERYSDEGDELEVTDTKAARKKAKEDKRALKAAIEEQKTPFQIFLEYVRVIAIGALIAFLLCRFVIINAVVPTGSMIPAIQLEDRLIGLRLTYYFSDPKRGDVAIFKTPDPQHLNDLYVKRVIGLPGETVQIKAGEVWITTVDGDTFRLEESSYLNEVPDADSAVNNATYTLGDDEYFMMGDNRNHSDDSRYWGSVERKKILAKAVFKYYKGFSAFKTPDYN